MISDIKERFRIDAAEAYDKQIDENREMIRAGRMGSHIGTERRMGPDGIPHTVNIFSPMEQVRPFSGRVEAVKGLQKNKWAAGFGYGVLFVLGVVAFMALMLF